MIIGLIFGVYVLGWCIFRAALSYKLGCEYQKWVDNGQRQSYSVAVGVWDERVFFWPWIWPLVIVLWPIGQGLAAFSRLFGYFENLGRKHGC